MSLLQHFQIQEKRLHFLNSPLNFNIKNVFIKRLVARLICRNWMVCVFILGLGGYLVRKKKIHNCLQQKIKEQLSNGASLFKLGYFLSRAGKFTNDDDLLPFKRKIATVP